MKRKINKRDILWTRKLKLRSTDSEEKLINLPDQFRDFSASAFRELLEHRTILINGDIDEEMIERVVVQIEKLSTLRPKEPITIMINTFGGSVYEMHSIVDAIRSTKTPITTVALGKVMSAGFDIFLSGDYRVANTNSIFLVHNGNDNLGDSTIVGHINESEYYKRLLEMSSRYYASRTNASQKEWLDILQSNRDRYIFVDEAKKMGIVHDIQEPQISKYKPSIEKKRKKRRILYRRKLNKSKRKGSRK